METVRDKWKLGLTRIISHNNAKDSFSNVSVDTEGDVSNMEVRIFMILYLVSQSCTSNK